MASSRQVVFEELHGRLEARITAIERRVQGLKGEFEKLSVERIELRAKLRVLEKAMQKHIK